MLLKTAYIIYRKIGLGGTVLLLTTSLLSSCYEDVIVPAPTPPITGDVSFSEGLQPIFDASCNSPGCHNNGGVAPNLSTGAAYGALVNGGYIDTQNPSSSSLYQWMAGNRDVDMPPSGPIASVNATVLAWIQQGALNN